MYTGYLELSSGDCTSYYTNMDNDTITTIDDAMVVIQDSTATITATTERLTDLESGNKKVLEVVENLLTKVSDLENKIPTSYTPRRLSKITPPLYIRVSG